MGAATATAEAGGGVKVFRGGALDFSLSSSGLSLTGKTNSASELKAFIERLKVLAAVLPDAAQDKADDNS